MDDSILMEKYIVYSLNNKLYSGMNGLVKNIKSARIFNTRKQAEKRAKSYIGGGSIIKVTVTVSGFDIMLGRLGQ